MSLYDFDDYRFDTQTYRYERVRESAFDKASEWEIRRFVIENFEREIEEVYIYMLEEDPEAKEDDAVDVFIDENRRMVIDEYNREAEALCWD